MILKRFYEDKLAHASYLVGCAKSGEAIVIDPHRDIDVYLQAAAAEGLRIAAVTETHIHADYLSGARELAHRSGAVLYLSDEGPMDWKYVFASDPNVVLVRHGDTIRVGNLRFDVIHTAGHTPEHITFVLTDESAGDVPVGAFTGDFLFVGDVGRPDLLERAAGLEGTMEAGARTLFDSIRTFDGAFGDGLLLFPAHGAGSACGKALGGLPISSLGYERRTNWGLRAADEPSFVREVLAGQPDPPPYFKHMKHLNKAGPAILGEMPNPPKLAPEQVNDVLEGAGVLIDLRPSHEAESGFLAGSILVEGDRSFIKWAGWLVPFGRPLFLLGADATQAAQAARDLAMIGFDDVRGWFGFDTLDAHRASLAVVPAIGLEPFLEAAQSEMAQIVDVRTPGEWNEGHLAMARHIPLGELQLRASELDPGVPTIVYCGSGGRSPMAAGILVGRGFRSVLDFQGGHAALVRAGVPMEPGRPVLA